MLETLVTPSGWGVRNNGKIVIFHIDTELDYDSKLKLSQDLIKMIETDGLDKYTMEVHSVIEDNANEEKVDMEQVQLEMASNIEYLVVMTELNEETE